MHTRKQGWAAFQGRSLQKGDVIGYYYGTLVYRFTEDVLNARGVHGEGVMAFTREQFHTSAIRLAKEIFSSDGILHTVWLGPSKVACLRFMNEPRSLPEEAVPAGERYTASRSENVKFVDIGGGRLDCTTFGVVSVQATRNVGPGVAPLVDYKENCEIK